MWLFVRGLLGPRGRSSLARAVLSGDLAQPNRNVGDSDGGAVDGERHHALEPMVSVISRIPGPASRAVSVRRAASST